MTTDQQPRIPGVRYRKEVRQREETVVIDGQAETRTVAYAVDVPVPPRDWDRIVLRGVTAVALVVTVLAVVGTTASIGGLLAGLIAEPLAYAVAVVFDLSWIAALALQWLERLDPERARAANVAGWGALGVSMAATIAFGHHHEETAAGAAGASVALLSKGLWTFVLRYYSVPLSDPVAFWLRSRRERAAATQVIAQHQRRSNSLDLYLRAVYGDHAHHARQLTHTQASAVTAGQPTTPVQDNPNLPGHATSAVPGTVSAQVPAPAAPPAETARPAVPDTSETAVQDTPRPVQNTPGGDVVPMERPSKADIIRSALAKQPDLNDEALMNAVTAVHGEPDTFQDRIKLADTVRRTRNRLKKEAS